MQNEAALWRIAKMKDSAGPATPMMQWRDEQNQSAKQSQDAHGGDPTWWMLEDARMKIDEASDRLRSLGIEHEAEQCDNMAREFPPPTANDETLHGFCWAAAAGKAKVMSARLRGMAQAMEEPGVVETAALLERAASRLSCVAERQARDEAGMEEGPSVTTQASSGLEQLVQVAMLEDDPPTRAEASKAVAVLPEECCRRMLLNACCSSSAVFALVQQELQRLRAHAAGVMEIMQGFWCDEERDVHIIAHSVVSRPHVNRHEFTFERSLESIEVRILGSTRHARTDLHVSLVELRPDDHLCFRVDFPCGHALWELGLIGDAHLEGSITNSYGHRKAVQLRRGRQQHRCVTQRWEDFPYKAGVVSPPPAMALASPLHRTGLQSERLKPCGTKLVSTAVLNNLSSGVLGDDGNTSHYRTWEDDMNPKSNS